MQALLAALALALAPVGAPAATPAEAQQLQPVAVAHPVYIIRHMQKADGPDPALTAEGAANAQRLAAMLKDKGIAAIFATRTKRAMETAAPLAKALGLQVRPYDPTGFGLLAAQAAAAGGPVLVVGHSNTVPDLVESFGGERPAPIADEEYGTLYDVEPGGTVVAMTVR